MNIVNPNKKYKNSKRLVYSCQYHVIFCTKYRRQVITDIIANRLKEVITENQTRHDYEIIDLEVMSDHVHLLIDVNPKIGIYTTINKIKGVTSRTLREEFSELKSKLPALWTNSKFISTVGSVSLEIVKKYIENQKGK